MESGFKSPQFPKGNGVDYCHLSPPVYIQRAPICLRLPQCNVEISYKSAQGVPLESVLGRIKDAASAAVENGLICFDNSLPRDQQDGIFATIREHVSRAVAGFIPASETVIVALNGRPLITNVEVEILPTGVEEPTCNYAAIGAAGY